MKLHMNWTALAVALSLGLSVASAAPDPEGLQGGPQLTSDGTELITEAQINEFLEWASENPERLQATADELKIATDIEKIQAGPSLPGEKIAGTYLLRKPGQAGSTATLEVGADLSVTRTVRNGTKVVSQMRGQGSLEKGKLKVAFGKEQIKAEGAARKLGRLFKRGWRKVRTKLEVREASYRFPGAGLVRGKFLGMPERGILASMVLPVEGTYILPCAKLELQQTSRANRLRVVRTDHMGNVLVGKGKLRGGRLSVKFKDDSRGNYTLRLDNRKITGNFSQYHAYPVDREERESVNDSGWRAGVTPEPSWLQRGMAKVKALLSKVKAKVKALATALVHKIQAMLASAKAKSAALLKAISTKLKQAMAGLMGKIERGAGRIRARLERG